MNENTTTRLLLTALIFIPFLMVSQSKKEIQNLLSNKSLTYMPDFSFAGYHNGEKAIPTTSETIIFATDFGVIANDVLDDSKALLSAMAKCETIAGPVILALPAGKIILSSVLYIERSNFILRGEGADEKGTEIYCPRPMMYLENPESLTELREYLETFHKVQKEKENNINLPFSQYAWSGGMIWTQVPGERVKSYLEKYDPKINVLAKINSGKRGKTILTASEIKNLKVGDIVELELFNKEGENADIIKAMYNNADIKAGSHHWKFPSLPLVRQQVEVVEIKGDKITIKDPLLLDIKPSYAAQLIEWKHLTEVGIENLKITIPNAPRVAHHVEPGFNGIFLTRVYNSWVNNVTIHNADSGILTEEIANTTIQNIITKGSNVAHYTVASGGVHNVLIKNLKVYNDAVHPLSFNTFSTKNVYQNCTVYKNPVLDQHSGANHQNLFDNVTVYLEPLADNSYPIFGGGGADYWKPSHAAFSTFWNLNVQVKNSTSNSPILLNGLKDGPYATLAGVHGNTPLKVSYEPNATIVGTNEEFNEIPPLYDYQLKKRLE
ncbi:right-handed parallel beta-helix repeat-containing protein [Flavobacterium fluviatile]|uniref:right-handed parallel beta-helix repeat-containing protein n=1 Tax=Flavobacterium fluviatile TaxID=1862387 RepID=UPI001FCA7959|nr:right-handed parallel beta-helix repeat-containing protein [Flavobacterium fluviatile]